MEGNSGGRAEMTDVTVETMRAGLVASREGLMRAIAGVTEQQFKQRPAAAEGQQGWSIAEVLAHLLWSEKLRSARIRIAVTAGGQTIMPSAMEEHEAAARSGRLAPVPQLIHGLLAARRELERLVEEAGRAGGGLERSVVHPVNGVQTIGWMVSEKVIAHEVEHVAQIEALRVA